MRIQHNIMAMNSYRNYNNNTKALSANLEKLSSGYKINRAGDDAAGLAISEKMRAQIKGLDAAQKNVKDGISLVKTAEGAMQEVQDMLSRMKYLATQSSNGTYDNDVDRAALQDEINSLCTEIDRIADSANFNGIKLLDGTQSKIASQQFTQRNGATAAKFEVTFEGTGKDYIGGTIKVGTTTITVKECDASNKTETLSGDVLYVKASTTATTIVDKIKGHAGLTGLKFTNTAGDSCATQLSASGAKITWTDNSSSKTTTDIKVSSMPQVAANGGLKLQIGDTSDPFNQMRANANDIHVSSLFLGASNIPDISTQDGAAKAIDYIQSAINQVSSIRGGLGAVQNRLDHTLNNLSVMTENIQDAESTIRDTDVANEMMAYTKNNILIQSAQAMLAQSNAVPQGVLQLLQ